MDKNLLTHKINSLIRQDLWIYMGISHEFSTPSCPIINSSFTHFFLPSLESRRYKDLHT